MCVVDRRPRAPRSRASTAGCRGSSTRWSTPRRARRASCHDRRRVGSIDPRRGRAVGRSARAPTPMRPQSPPPTSCSSRPATPTARAPPRRRTLPAALDEAVTDAAPRREIVTLVVDAPALDAAPLRTEVYAVPGRAARIRPRPTQTARWAVAARGRRRLDVTCSSVAFDGPDGAAATAVSTTPMPPRSRRAEASALLGVPLDAASVRAVAPRARSRSPPPASALGHARARRTPHASRCTRIPGSPRSAPGSSGSGLAQVVADARERGRARAPRGAVRGDRPSAN